MKQGYFEIIENVALTRDVFRMKLQGDTSAITAAGHFVNIKLDGFFLRRPISVCDVEGEVLTIIYKVVGDGTHLLAHMSTGTKLDILTGLGNGYDLEKSGANPLLIGGGVGVPPMYNLAKRLVAQDKKVTVIMGFNTSNELFYKDEFETLGARVLVTTVDGSAGIKGFVTDAIAEAGDVSCIYTCGPEPMLKAIYNATDCPAYFSFEERMGCGFGACVGCTCKTKYGNKRICKDGPVLCREEIIW